MASSGWYAGVVKEVQSGDTLVVAGASTNNGIAAERRISLSSLSAPRMPRRDGSNVSEEFAWESREYLRKLTIGRACTFRIDYSVDAIGRDFGSVMVDLRPGETVNVALAVVTAGWARVRGSADPKAQSPDIEALRAAAADAEAAGRGLHDDDELTRVQSCFAFDADSAAIASDYVAQRGKGVPIPAVVDAVLTGSTLKVVTLDDRTIVTVALAGATCPNVRRNSSGALEGEPYGLEARALTEAKVLCREVRVLLYSGDTGARAYGEVVYADDGALASLAATLLAEGAARYSNWSARLLPTGAAAVATAAALQKKEAAAQADKKGLWEKAAPANGAAARDGGGQAVDARVVEVASGDTLVLKLTDGRVVRMSLASIRAPRLRPPGGGEAEPFAREAKEALRKLAIGRDVSATLEFARTLPPNPAMGAAGEATTLQMGNAAVTGARGGTQLAAALVRRGLATVQGGREGDERSSIFGELLAAEEEARERKAGAHGAKAPPAARINDCSLPGSAARARQYLPFLQRAAATPCVVEHAMSGSRVKVLVPKESVVLVFSPSGVKTPSRGAPARGGLPAVPAEPHGEAAYQFVREHFLQRDATITVESCDKAGTLLGRLTAGGKDMSVALLEAGLGSLHPSFNPERVAGAAQLEAAQARAQAARRGQWEHYDPAAEAEAAAAEAAAVAPGAPQAVTVTHVAGGTCLLLQPADGDGGARVAAMERACADAAAGGFEGYASAPPRPGAAVLAQFSGDRRWYRGHVEGVVAQGTKNEAFRVYFVDYGNSEAVPAARVRPLAGGPAAARAIAAEPPLAARAQLAHVRVPEVGDGQWGEAAADALGAIALGGRYVAHTLRAVRAGGGSHPRDAAPVKHVVLYEADAAEDAERSVNARMLDVGYARLPAAARTARAAADPVVAALQAAQGRALREHVGMFRYGDPGDSDDDDEPRRR